MELHVWGNVGVREMLKSYRKALQFFEGPSHLVLVRDMYVLILHPELDHPKRCSLNPKFLLRPASAALTLLVAGPRGPPAVIRSVSGQTPLCQLAFKCPVRPI